MTTIVYRDGVIAADTGMCVGGSRVGHVQKIARNGWGDLAGAAGSAGYNAAFIRWFLSCESDAPPEPQRTPDLFDRGVIFRASRIIEVHEPDGTFNTSAKYYAFGSGAPEALGALYMGATAEEAVRAAIEHDSGTFGDVTVLRHTDVEAAE